MLPNYESSISKMISSLKTFPWEKKMAYANYLAQSFYYVRHSTRLLALAAGRMPLELDGFHRRFLDHTKEEERHELLAIKDITNLEFDLKDFSELPETKMFWETQYYKIEHSDPIALLGYILALEATASSVCSWIKDQVEKYHGKRVSSFLHIHSADDPEHVEKALVLVKSLDEKRQKLVDENLLQSAVSYEYMLRAILNSSISLQVKSKEGKAA